MEGLKEIPSLSDKDINFVKVIFGITKEELKCYRNKQSRLNRMMQDPVLEKFVLIGSTSISLQLGHRISVDLDLFTNESFDEQ